MEQRQASWIGIDQDVLGQLAWISIIYEWSMGEKRGTDLGVAATGITDQDEGWGLCRTLMNPGHNLSRKKCIDSSRQLSREGV